MLFRSRTITLGVADPGPVAVADVDGGGPDVVTLHRASGEIGVVPLVGGTEQRYRVDPEGGGAYGPRALAVGDLDGDGAPDALVATAVGMRFARHRLDVLPATFGGVLVTASDPLARTAGLGTSVRPQLALSAAAVNATAAVRLVGRNGGVQAAALEGGGTDRLGLFPTGALARGAYAIRVLGLVGVGGDRAERVVVPFFVGPVPDQVPPSVVFTVRPVGPVSPGARQASFTSNDPSAVFACSIVPFHSKTRTPASSSGR